MKNFFTSLLLLSGVLYLSSCSNKVDGTTNSLIIPPEDSVTVNSTIILYYNNDTFVIHDLTVKNLPIESFFASDPYNPTDSIWTTTIVLTDYLKKQISLNLTANRDSSSALGIYYVTTNSSTLTDYTNGENRVYSIMEGSYLTITASNYPITGTMALTLRYNNDTIPATGTFSIYN